jgi:predicted oxidoreductase
VSISFNQNSPRYPDGWEGTMEYCRMNGVSLQAWSPLAQGVFGGSMDGQPDNVKKAGALIAEYAQRYDAPAEAILLAWLLKHPANIQPVLGTTRPERLRACAKALSVSLSREEWYSLFAAARGAPMP